MLPIVTRSAGGRSRCGMSDAARPQPDQVPSLIERSSWLAPSVAGARNGQTPSPTSTMRLSVITRSCLRRVTHRLVECRDEHEDVVAWLAQSPPEAKP